MAKRAVVRVLHAEPLSPGKYWIAVEGGEAEVEEALDAGVDVAGPARIDHTLLPNADDALFAALRDGAQRAAPEGSVGVLELDTLAAAVRACDAGLKAAAVTLVDLHLARGIGGKGYVVFTGDLGDVEAALDAGEEAAGAAALVGRELIANPDAALAEAATRPGSRR